MSFVDDPPNPDGIDGLRDVVNRHLGAFGFPAPYGHESTEKGRRNLSFNMDIVGGTVNSLCEAYLEVVRPTGPGTSVNLLFDHETSDSEVQSPYTHDCLQITLKQSGPLQVRVPPWLTREEIGIGGTNTEPTFANGYLVFSSVAAGETVRLRFPLKDTQITLSERLHIRPIRVTLRGDAVTRMDNFGANLTFFDPPP